MKTPHIEVFSDKYYPDTGREIAGEIDGHRFSYSTFSGFYIQGVKDEVENQVLAEAIRSEVGLN